MSKTTFVRTFLISLLAATLLLTSFLFASCGKNGKTELLSDYVHLSQSTFVYSGQEIKPAVWVQYKDKTFVQGEDFVTIYENNINAGTAKVVISALDSSKNLKGRIEKTFTIQKRDLNDASVTVQDLTFSGDPNVLPKVNVKIGEKEFDIDGFNVSVAGGYPDGQNYVTISAKENSNFVGSITKPFVVNYMNLNAATVLVEQTFFDGTEKTPNFEIKVNNFVLPNSVKDALQITYENNINASENAKINILVQSQNHYFAQNSQKEISFAIIPAGIAANVQIAEIEDEQYDENPHKIAPQVSAFEQTLIENQDYEVLYFRNGVQLFDDSDFVDGGYITIRVVGINNFDGMKETTYFIKGIDISENPNLLVNINDTNLVYSGYAQTPQIEITLSGEEIFSYQSTFENNINAGVNSAAATITFFGNYAGTVLQTFSIQPKSIADFLLELAETEVLYLPNGATVECLLKEYEGATPLCLGSDFILTYTNNEQVSTDQNKAGVYATGIGNYSGSTQTQNFSIVARELTEDMLDSPQTQLVFDGTDKKPTIVIKINEQTIPAENYLVSFFADEQKSIPATDFVSAGQTIYVEITAQNNLSSGTLTFSYEILQGELLAQNTSVTLSENEFVFDGTQKLPLVTQVLFCENILDASNYDISYEHNTNAGTAYVIISGKNNVTGTIAKTFVILPSNMSEVVATFKDDLTYNAQTQNIIPTVAGPVYFTQNDYDINYFVVENGIREALTTDEVQNLVSAGTYEIEVVGKQNFAGTILGTTIIKRIENAITNNLKINNWQFGKAPENPVMQAVFGQAIFVYAQKGSQNYSAEIPTEIGSYVCKGEIFESTNYFGISQTCEFEITKGDLNDATISLTELTISAGAVESIAFDVFMAGVLLTTDDYTSNINYSAGEITITLEAKNSSQFVVGEKEQTFEEKVVGNLEIICENSYVYEDTINVTFDSCGQSATLKLYQKIDFCLMEVENNTILDAGNYVAILTASADGTRYQKIIQKEFVVEPKQYNINFEFYSFGNTTYSGQDVSKNFEIFDDIGSMLIHNKDYTLLITGSTINAGNVQVTINFVNNYSGATTKNFEILKKAISAPEKIQTPYTGSQIANNVCALGDFVESVDYEVEYYIDMDRTILATTEQKTNAGTLYGKIKSLNQSLEDANFEIEITKVQNEFLQELLIQNFEYGDNVEKPEINAKFGEAVIMFSSYDKYTHTYSEFVEWTNTVYPQSFGTYAIKAEVQGTQNYYEIHTSTVLFQISRQELKRENITVTPTEFVYQEGTAQVPTVVVLDKFGNALTEGTLNDYKLRWFKQDGTKVLVQPENIIERGTYIVNITGRQNYQTTNDIEITFEII